MKGDPVRSAEDIAKHLIALASVDPEPTPVTHLQVQKLLYYVRGWSLAEHATPLFDGTFEAWTHGPAVRELYTRFKAFGSAPIPAAEGQLDETLTERERELVAWVWRRYGRFTAAALREMTHREAPWRDARGALPNDAPSNTPISDQSLLAHFRSLAERERRFQDDDDVLVTAISDARSGRHRPFIGSTS